jgi:hypothetical protein
LEKSEVIGGVQKHDIEGGLYFLQVAEGSLSRGVQALVALRGGDLEVFIQEGEDPPVFLHKDAVSGAPREALQPKAARAGEEIQHPGAFNPVPEDREEGLPNPVRGGAGDLSFGGAQSASSPLSGDDSHGASILR